MSKKRSGKWGPRGTGPNGRKLCYCGCGEELPADYDKRCTSISGHYDAWAKIHRPATVRAEVFKRDKGICAHCGLDTEAAQKTYIQHLYEFAKARWPDRPYIHHTTIEYLRQPGKPQPPDGFPGSHRSWWEADHIIPVIEGGGECGLENYRTLCIPCHKLETKTLAKRRAQQRREAKRKEKLANAVTLDLR